MHKSTGFTILEMIVVTIVIAVLVSLAIPNYLKALERTKCGQAIHALKTMRNAAFDYYAESETFIGMTIALLSQQAGANFTNNPDWIFVILSGSTDGTFTLQASRTGGPHVANPTITLDQDDVWGGTYPKDDPGNF